MVADFSYVGALAGFVYVAFVVDVFSRRILGWQVTTTKHTGMVTDALRQALQVRCRGEHDWVAAGLIHHSDAGSQGGFNRSSQHLDRGGVHGQTSWVGDGVDGKVGDEVAGRTNASAGGRARVLASDREGAAGGGGRERGRSVTSGRQPLIPPRWRDATFRLATVVGPLPVVC